MSGPLWAGIGHRGGDNLGDDIQSIAAERFLPRVDFFLPREGLDRTPPGEGRIKAILNGWFLHDPRRWPPHPRIEPLFISFHVRPSAPSRLRFWAPTPQRTIVRRHASYLRRHGPVGARDRTTEAMLRGGGIEAFYSACLTLTLRAPPARRAGVVACDLPAPLLAEVEARSSEPPLAVSHRVDPVAPDEARRERAEDLLRLYAGARCVVTARLHCALPCLALGTPVLFLPTLDHPWRLQPALDLVRCASAEDFLARSDGFDPDAPPANPDRHLPLAEALRRRCEAFVAAG